MRILAWLRSRLPHRNQPPADDYGVENPESLRRLRIVLRLILVWVLVVLWRLIQLQVVEHDDYARLAESQQTKMVKLQAPRGMILDRNRKPLAMSVPVDSVCVNPTRIPDITVAAEILSSVLDMEYKPLAERLSAAKAAHKGFLWIKRKAPNEETERLRTYKLQYVEFRPESQRYYPKGRLAAQVVGAVGTVEDEERGVVGLESYFDDELQGRAGTVRVITDSQQRGLDSFLSEEAIPGREVVSTIDERIQWVAERELEKAVLNNDGCKTGSIVVMDPKTGEILAMASYPSFDPNEPLKKGDDLSPRLNLAISAPFEPGSVFKVITLSAALEVTRLDPSSVIPCGNGVLNLFGRVIHDHDPFASLSMTDVLAHSSNIGAINVGLKVGEKALFDYVLKFGFGRETGVELPAESAGLVRRLKNWTKSSIGSVAMGHEVMATTLQLAQACAVIANDGRLIRPTIVMKQNGGAQLRNARNEAPALVLKDGSVVKMRKMMQAVVDGGTGKKAKLDGFLTAGKTGSAQIWDQASRSYTHRYNASFMGFAPVGNPAVVVVVTLNGSTKYGGAVAGPVFKEVAGAALRIMGVQRAPSENQPPANEQLAETMNDLPATELLSEPVRIEESAPSAGPKVPDFRGKSMREVLKVAAAASMPVNTVGSGVARKQMPPPGAPLPPGERVRVEFAR